MLKTLERKVLKKLNLELFDSARLKRKHNSETRTPRLFPTRQYADVQAKVLARKLMENREV